MDEMNEQDYNQVKANATGKTYYQVTSGEWGCNLWATCDDEAAYIIFTMFPEKNGQFLTIKAITQPTKTENGGI